MKRIFVLALLAVGSCASSEPASQSHLLAAYEGPMSQETFEPHKAAEPVPQDFDMASAKILISECEPLRAVSVQVEPCPAVTTERRASIRSAIYKLTTAPTSVADFPEARKALAQLCEDSAQRLHKMATTLGCALP
jgi:hypothetical protein